MKPTRTVLLGAAVALGLCSTSSAVVTVGLHGSNQGIGSINVNVVGTTINIEENWTGPGMGVLEITGLEPGQDYVVNKTLNNNTSSAWDRVANELLDPLGADTGEDAADVTPYPAFVPAGFSTSNDNDGLSFAQGSGIPRVSSVFASVLADELADTRDFLDFFNGTLPDGGNGTISYGVRENSGTQQPFLLVQRPNASSRNVPDAGGTLLLLSLGLMGIRALRRK